MLIGFLDSGIDYQSALFRRLDGSTRIEAIWDQTIQSGTPPESFAYGSEYTRDMIDEALRSDDPPSLVPSVDETGHGTYAASLAAGSADAGQQFLGAAPGRPSLLSNSSRPNNISGTIISSPGRHLLSGNRSDAGAPLPQRPGGFLGMPLVVCMTCCTSMGGHGYSPLPFLIDGYSTRADHITVAGTGNEGDQRHHYYGSVDSSLEGRPWSSGSTKMSPGSRWNCGRKCPISSPSPSCRLPGKIHPGSRSGPMPDGRGFSV